MQTGGTATHIPFLSYSLHINTNLKNAPCHDAHEHLGLPLRRCRRSLAERLCVTGEAHPAQGHDEEREDRGDGEGREESDGQVEWDLGIAPIHSLEHRDVADHKHQV